MSQSFVGCRRAIQLALLLAVSACGGRAPEPRSPSAGRLCCQEFNYVLEVTIFKIDVVRLFLRIDAETARTISSLVATDRRSSALEDSVTGVLMDTPSAHARMTFLMSMSAQRFLENTAETLRGIGEEGLLTSAEVERLIDSSRERFAFLDDSGIAAGDYLEQVLSGDSVTTAYVTKRGQRLLNDVQVGKQHRIALLGSYFSRASDFRKGLLDQLFGDE